MQREKAKRKLEKLRHKHAMEEKEAELRKSHSENRDVLARHGLTGAIHTAAPESWENLPFTKRMGCFDSDRCNDDKT